jgi:hypothetical protein
MKDILTTFPDCLASRDFAYHLLIHLLFTSLLLLTGHHFLLHLYKSY